MSEGGIGVNQRCIAARCCPKAYGTEEGWRRLASDGDGEHSRSNTTINCWKVSGYWEQSLKRIVHDVRYSSDAPKPRFIDGRPSASGCGMFRDVHGSQYPRYDRGSSDGSRELARAGLVRRIGVGSCQAKIEHRMLQAGRSGYWREPADVSVT